MAGEKMSAQQLATRLRGVICFTGTRPYPNELLVSSAETIESQNLRINNLERQLLKCESDLRVSRRNQNSDSD